LKGVDLEIEKGDFVAITGPSGSGKSTLMNILGALDKPTEGKYFLKGQDIGQLNNNKLAEYRNKEVGFVFQQFNLLSRTSVFDNVALPGIYGQLDQLDNRVLEVLSQVGLADKAQNKPNEISGGQMQRVAIARALLMNPSIIMADEPTGNLDTKTAHEIMDLIVKVHNQGNTILLITHEEDIAAFAQRHIKLLDGEIVHNKKQLKQENK
jgi:putative ABC transport system ATP-binding protein